MPRPDPALATTRSDLVDGRSRLGAVTSTTTSSPELLVVDGRADIYAVGCVAYWLLTGHGVFARETPLATSLAHVRDLPEPPSLRTELHVPAALDALILDCLAKDPAHRPEHVAELVRRLDEIDVPPWTPDNARRWWRCTDRSAASAPRPARTCRRPKWSTRSSRNRVSLDRRHRFSSHCARIPP